MKKNFIIIALFGIFLVSSVAYANHAASNGLPIVCNSYENDAVCDDTMAVCGDQHLKDVSYEACKECTIKVNGNYLYSKCPGSTNGTNTSALPNLIVRDFTFETKDSDFTGKGAMDVKATIKNTGIGNSSGQFYVNEETSAGYGYVSVGFRASSPAFQPEESKILKSGESREVIIGSYLFPKDTDIQLLVNITADKDFGSSANSNLISEDNENDNSLVKVINFRLDSSGGSENNYDLNSDGKTDWKDYELLIDVVIGSKTCPSGKNCDFNDSGQVTVADMVFFGNYINNKYDINGDGKADMTDMDDMAAVVAGTKSCPEAGKCDISKDGAVNAADKDLMLNFLTTKYDLNSDGKVDQEEDDMMGQIVAGNQQCPSKKSCDLNGDGQVAVADWTYMRNFIAKYGSGGTSNQPPYVTIFKTFPSGNPKVNEKFGLMAATNDADGSTFTGSIYYFNQDPSCSLLEYGIITNNTGQTWLANNSCSKAGIYNYSAYATDSK